MGTNSGKDRKPVGPVETNDAEKRRSQGTSLLKAASVTALLTDPTKDLAAEKHTGLTLEGM